jgi:hypothetical protein
MIPARVWKDVTTHKVSYAQLRELANGGQSIQPPARPENAKRKLAEKLINQAFHKK